MFKGEELLCASRATGVVTAMPFYQDRLYSVPQPGESDAQNAQLYTHDGERKTEGEKQTAKLQERQAELQ